ncbi:MAG: hypothetical protein CMF62_03835 [Magnetococcales bacterium]|nr:hypothetical protein [Magnetococcales bacterium]
MIIDKIKKIESEIDDYNRKIRELEKQLETFKSEINENEKSIEQFTLNENQRKAVENIEGNNIIIACPGSGKTHTLISKVVNLIKNHNINPEFIYLITFTKKASCEMSNRLKKFIKELPYVGTLHSLAYRTLQKYHNINYTILDDKDSNKFLKEAVDLILEKNLDDDIKSSIYKLINITYDKMGCDYEVNLDKYKNIIEKIFKEYQIKKDKYNYLDFNDLMRKFYEFLQLDISNDFKNNVKYILFDEYQDVNPIQDLILKSMNKNQNLTVVGDDAQAIYAFRGSDVSYIINFENQYEKIKKFHLEKNYRSPPPIINLCNDIISNNKMQLDKRMVPISDTIKIKPKVTGFETSQLEVSYIINQIVKNKKKVLNLMIKL